MNIHKSKVPGVNLLDYVPQFLNVTGTTSGIFGEVIYGELGSLKIKVSESTVKIHDCSLSKFIKGNGYETSTRTERKSAIEKISDELHLDFYNADVSRLDIFYDLIMGYQEKLYYPHLGQSGYYDRSEQNNGVYYTIQKNQKVFYGKVHELKFKRQPISKELKNLNIIRYEFRMKQRLKETLNKERITASMLFDEMFSNDLVNLWQEEFNKIEKINYIKMKPTGSSKDLINDLAHIAITQLGQPNVLNQVQEWQGKGLITRKQAYDQRHAVKKLLKGSYLRHDTSDLILELNRKVSEAAEAMKAS